MLSKCRLHVWKATKPLLTIYNLMINLRCLLGAHTFIIWSSHIRTQIQAKAREETRYKMAGDREAGRPKLKP